MGTAGAETGKAVTATGPLVEEMAMVEVAMAMAAGATGGAVVVSCRRGR